jgi:hypothetical protein
LRNFLICRITKFIRNENLNKISLQNVYAETLDKSLSGSKKRAREYEIRQATIKLLENFKNGGLIGDYDFKPSIEKSKKGRDRYQPQQNIVLYKVPVSKALIENNTISSDNDEANPLDQDIWHYSPGDSV